MQLLEVSSLVSNAGILNDLVELGVGVLAVVVAVVGGEQFQHVGGIVVVHGPTVTADIVVTGAAHGDEAGPLDLVDVHGDAQLTPSLLQVLGNGDVVAGIVGAVGDGGEALAIRVTGLSQQALGLLEVGRVVIADVGLAAVGVVHEVAVRVHDAGAYQSGSGGVDALHDGVGNVVAVDGQAQSLTDADIGEGLFLIVQGDVVGAHDLVQVEVAAVLGSGQAGDLIGGDVLDQLGLAAVVSSVGSAGILQQQQGDGVRDDLAGIPAANVVGVLAQNDTLGGDPLGDHVGAVADVGVRLGAPGIAVGLHGSLLYRRSGHEGSQLIKVGAGVRQLDGQGLAVLAGMDVQGIPIGVGGGVAVCIGVADGILVAVDHADNSLGIGGGGVRVGQALEAVLKVSSGQVRAVAPLQAVTHMERPGQAVVADFVALGLAGLDFVVLVDDEQGLLDGDEGVAAVDGSVQGRVQGLGVGAELDGKTGGTCFGSVSSLAGSVGGAGACGGTAGSQRHSQSASHSSCSNVAHFHDAFSFLNLTIDSLPPQFFKAANSSNYTPVRPAITTGGVDCNTFVIFVVFYRAAWGGIRCSAL